MAFINVAEWTPDNVNDWLKGLDDCILPYVHFFINNNINGCRLLLLSSDDLEKLNVTKVGHQEIILDGVDLLKHLHYNFASETLQSLALRLGCKSRSLYNQLKQDELNDVKPRVSTKTLSGVCDILSSVKAFISWIDTYPFDGQDPYIPIRKTILTISIELASTSQRDQFVEKPNEVIKKSCLSFAELCDDIVQGLNDSLAIQPAHLEIVTIKKKPDEEVGMQINSSYSGVHIVGGVKFQSPVHRCGRIEDGDEIVQVNYQTVVGWQSKKLVNQMKQYSTEIILTVKKRPRHSNILGQVFVLKPYKIPARKANKSQGSRVRNAATTTNTSDEENFERQSKETEMKRSVYPILTRKPKLRVRRRATISGSSPTATYAPIRIEDLVAQTNKESVFRSVSHDPSKISNKLTISPPEVPPENPTPPTKTLHIHSIEKSNSASTVPYAKVHPLSLVEKRFQNEGETIPKQIDESRYNQRSLCPPPNSKYQPLSSNFPHDYSIYEKTKATTSSPSSGTSCATGQCIGVVAPSQHYRENPCPHDSREQSDVCPKESIKRENLIQKPAVPSREGLNNKLRLFKVSRRIACKDLGEGDCYGWLYQRKEQNGCLVPNANWLHRWVVLTKVYLYCFKTEQEKKADCLLYLPSFKLSPSLECKSKKCAFKLFNSNTAFQFATDSRSDVNAWITRLAQICCTVSSPSPEKLREDLCYSETDDSDAGGSDVINRHEAVYTARNSSSGVSPSVSASSSSTDVTKQRSGGVRLSTSSSSSSIASAKLKDSESKPKQNMSSHLPNSCSSPAYVVPCTSRSANCVNPTLVTTKICDESESAYGYAQLSFPPQSPRRIKKVPAPSPVASPSPKFLSPTPYRRVMYSDKTVTLEPEVSMSQSWCSAQSGKPVQLQVYPGKPRQPPKPLPRISKLREISATHASSSDGPKKPNEMTMSLTALDSNGNRVVNSENLHRTSVNNPLYEQVPRKCWPKDDCQARIQKQEIRSNVVSVLDMEYNRLYGDKSPNEKPPSYDSLHLPYVDDSDGKGNSCKGIESDSASNSEGSGNSLPVMRSVSSSKLERTQSPASDHSLSSSSGISSYYSAYLEMPEQLKQVTNSSLSSVNTSCNSTKSNQSVVEEESALSTSTSSCSEQKLKNSQPSDSTVVEVNSDAKQGKSSTKSSFRLFSSPKLLKKLSTPKYQKERHLEKRDTKSTEEKTSMPAKLFLNSPRLTRAIFGVPKKEPSKPVSVSMGVQADSYSSDSSVNSVQLPQRARRPPAFKISTEYRNDCLDLPQTPDTPRKPTMGISMLGKHRSSNVSTDRAAIEAALFAAEENLPNGTTTSVNGNQFRDDWLSIAKIIDQLGLTLTGELKIDGYKRVVSKPVDDDKMCHLVLSLRALQRTLKDKQSESHAIDELLETSITVDKLRRWMEKYPHLSSLEC